MHKQNDQQLSLDQLSLDEAFAELEKITQEFEKGEVNLEAGIPKFKHAKELADYLKKRLTEIENEIEEVGLSDQSGSQSEGNG